MARSPSRLCVAGVLGTARMRAGAAAAAAAATPSWIRSRARLPAARVLPLPHIFILFHLILILRHNAISRHLLRRSETVLTNGQVKYAEERLSLLVE